MKRGTASLLGLALTAIAGPAAAAPTVDLHALTWFVHVDMITVDRPLGFYEDLIDQATAGAETVLKGDHGPFDRACCTELGVVSVSTFGTTGDGLDTPTDADFGAMRTAAGSPSGSIAFLVTELDLCNASTTAIGCADTPTCSGDPNDDPDLTLVVTMEAANDPTGTGPVVGLGNLHTTLAHERGHNACLGHVSADSCQLMRSSAGGGCLSISECDDFRDGRTTTGATCPCHLDTGGMAADQTACTESGPGGRCSGGLCGLAVDARALPLASGAEGVVESGFPLFTNAAEDALPGSNLTGGWADLGPFSGTNDEIKGLAYAAERGVLYGIADGSDDRLVTLDPSTLQITGTVGTLSGHPNVTALAFDPGPTGAPGDDRLFALSTQSDCGAVLGGTPCDSPDEFCDDELYAVDPDDASMTHIGETSAETCGGFQGLAYDAEDGVLYLSGFAGGSLYRFDDLTSCASFICDSTPCCLVSEITAVDLPRVASALAYSEATDKLYLVGTQSGERVFYNAIDIDAGYATGPEISVDGYTPRALAVPEPSLPLLQLSGVIALLLLGRRRARR